MEEFAASHNHAIWTCLVKILGIDGSAVSEAAKKAVTLPLSTGGLGIQNATRALPAAQWASWADALEMIRKRHPGVAAEIINHLRSRPQLSVNHSCPGFQGVAGSGRFRDAKLGGVGAGRKTESTKSRRGYCGTQWQTKDGSGQHQWCWRRTVSTNCGANSRNQNEF